MNKAKHYLQTANKAPSPPQSSTTLPRQGRSKAPPGLRARLRPAAGRASPCWSLGVPPDIPEHQGSLQGSDSLRRRPHAATTTQPSGDGPSPPRRRDKPSRGTILHQLKPNFLARCCPRSSGEQEPGWSSREFHIPRLKIHVQDSPSSSSSSSPVPTVFVHLRTHHTPASSGRKAKPQTSFKIYSGR